MVTSLTALSNLESLLIAFRFPQSPPLPTSLPPPIRVVLTALTFLHLDCGFGYSEDLISRIDTPRLNNLRVFIAKRRLRWPFTTPQFHRSYTKARADQHVPWSSRVINCVRVGTYIPNAKLGTPADDSQESPLLSHIEEIEMCGDYPSRLVVVQWESYSDLNPSQWLRLFHLLIGVKRLRVSKRLVPRIGSALQELVGGRTMEVLPALRDLALEGLQPFEPAPQGMTSFIDARELSGHPVEILDWFPAEGSGSE